MAPVHPVMSIPSGSRTLRSRAIHQNFMNRNSAQQNGPTHDERRHGHGPSQSGNMQDRTPPRHDDEAGPSTQPRHEANSQPTVDESRQDADSSKTRDGLRRGADPSQTLTEVGPTFNPYVMLQPGLNDYMPQALYHPFPLSDNPFLPSSVYTGEAEAWWSLPPGMEPAATTPIDDDMTATPAAPLQPNDAWAPPPTPPPPPPSRTDERVKAARKDPEPWFAEDNSNLVEVAIDGSAKYPLYRPRPSSSRRVNPYEWIASQSGSSRVVEDDEGARQQRRRPRSPLETTSLPPAPAQSTPPAEMVEAEIIVTPSPASSSSKGKGKTRMPTKPDMTPPPPTAEKTRVNRKRKAETPDDDRAWTPQRKSTRHKVQENAVKPSASSSSRVGFQCRAQKWATPLQMLSPPAVSPPVVSPPAVSSPVATKMRRDSCSSYVAGP